MCNVWSAQVLNLKRVASAPSRYLVQIRQQLSELRGILAEFSELTSALNVTDIPQLCELRRKRTVNIPKLSQTIYRALFATFDQNPPSAPAMLKLMLSKFPVLEPAQQGTSLKTSQRTPDPDEKHPDEMERDEKYYEKYGDRSEGSESEQDIDVEREEEEEEEEEEEVVTKRVWRDQVVFTDLLVNSPHLAVLLQPPFSGESLAPLHSVFTRLCHTHRQQARSALTHAEEATDTARGVLLSPSLRILLKIQRFILAQVSRYSEPSTEEKTGLEQTRESEAEKDMLFLLLSAYVDEVLEVSTDLVNAVHSRAGVDALRHTAVGVLVPVLLTVLTSLANDAHNPHDQNIWLLQQNNLFSLLNGLNRVNKTYYEKESLLLSFDKAQPGLPKNLPISIPSSLNKSHTLMHNHSR